MPIEPDPYLVSVLRNFTSYVVVGHLKNCRLLPLPIGHPLEQIGLPAKFLYTRVQNFMLHVLEYVDRPSLPQLRENCLRNRKLQIFNFVKLSGEL